MWQKQIHSLLALVSLHPSQGVRTSPPLYRGTCTWKILLMDKALHQFDMANELKYIYIQITSNYDVWFHPKTGLFCRCCRVSSHPTCHPDPTADEPVPSILTPSWHSFRGFGPSGSGSGAPRCRQRSKLYSWFPLTSCSKGVRGPGGPSRKRSCCVRKSLTQVGGKMVRGHVNANASFCLLMGAWWSMLLLVTDVYLNASQDWEWVLNVKHLVPSWSGCKGDSTEISRNPFGKLRRLVAEATLAEDCWISTKRFCTIFVGVRRK